MGEILVLEGRNAVYLSDWLRWKEFVLNEMMRDEDYVPAAELSERICTVRRLKECLEGKFDFVVIIEPEGGDSSN